MGVDEKVSIERMFISLPYVKKPFSSKVIKSFVPELRSRKCFSCFGIPMLSIYMRYGYNERFAYWYECVYFTYSCMAMLHMDMNTQEDTQIQRLHYFKKKRKRERGETTSVETKVYHGQLTRTGYSQSQILE